MALNVLIVDDSRTVQSVISKALRLSGLPVDDLFTASNGKEALEALYENWIDLVFTDINMPVMNGFDMIREMRDDELLCNVPVVVVSMVGSVSRIDELRAEGVCAYIRKPFTPEQVRAVVEQIVGISGGLLEPLKFTIEARPSCDIVRNVFGQVLEWYAFLFDESPDDGSGLIEPAGPLCLATARFQGPMNGVIALALPLELCGIIAANVLGTDLDRASVEAAGLDAVKELLNVTCGNLVIVLAGEEAVFDLSIPETVALSEEEWRAMAASEDAVTSIVEGKPVLLRLALEAQG